ncbi:MAG: hypothetical protein RhofKO_27420 [Rhodothermales bacterium]
MNTRISWAVGLLILLIIPAGCDVNSLDEGVKLYVDTDFLQHVATIQVMNADGTGDPVDNVVLTASGTGADQLFRLDGKKELKPVDGFLNLGVLPGNEPSEAEPLTFTLTARANGYITSARAFAVIDAESPAYQSLQLVEIANPPAGTSASQASVSADGSGTTAAATRVQTSATTSATVDIPAGIQLLDASGSPVGGTVQVSAVQYDPRSDASAALPTTSTQGVDANGNSLGDVFYIDPSTALGAITIEMSAGGNEVSRFSSPITVSYDVPADLVNPATGTPYKAGDQSDVWSFDETNNRWVKETQATVVDNGGVLQATYAQSHLSTWVVGNAVPPGCFFFQATVQSGIPSSSTSQKYFYTELEDASTNRVISSNYLQHKNNEIITFFFVPNASANVKVYDGNETCKGNLLAEAPVGNLCSFVGALNFPTINLDNDEIAVTTSGTCANNPDVELLPAAPILYKDASCGPNQWGPLAEMKSGEFTTKALTLGEQYDFSIKFGDTNFEYEDVTIETQRVTYDDGTVDININTTNTAGGTASTIDIIDVVYPADNCSAIN